MKVSHAILTVFLLSLSWTASSGSENAALTLNEILEQSAGSPRSTRNERAAPRDLLEVLLNVAVKTQPDRLDTVNDNYDKAEDRITGFVDRFNDFVGYDVLVVTATTVSTDSAAIVDAIEGFAATLVSQQFDNAIVRTFATAAVNSVVEDAVGNLNFSLNRNVSLELLKNLIAVTTINSTTGDTGTTSDNSISTDTDSASVSISSSPSVSISASRRKRDVGFPVNILVSAVRSYVANVLGPSRDSVGYCLNNVTDTLLGLVDTQNYTNPITNVVHNVLNGVVVPAAAVVQNVHDVLDALYTNIVNGTTSGSDPDDASAASESLDEGSLVLEDSDSENSDVVPRLAGSSSRGVVSVAMNWLNKRIKKYLTNVISSYYNAVGLLVTYPLRYLLNWIINFVLPCTTCTSLV